MQKDLFVPESHLLLRERPDGLVAVALSAHLAGLLGKPQYAECSLAPGAEISPGVPFASVETSKTAYEVALPFRAEFAEANGAAIADAQRLASSDAQNGWLCAVRPLSPDWRDGLLDEAGYAAYTAP